MKVEGYYLQALNYEKNPAKVESAKVPDNIFDLHNNEITFLINKDFREKKSALVRIETKIDPKNSETGVFSFLVRYFIRVSEISKEAANDVVNFAADAVWSKTHAHFAQALSDLNVPNFTFPTEPPTAEIKLGEERKKANHDTDKGATK